MAQGPRSCLLDWHARPSRRTPGTASGVPLPPLTIPVQRSGHRHPLPVLVGFGPCCEQGFSVRLSRVLTAVGLLEDNIGGPISTETRVNERIRVPEVRLIGPGGEPV